MPRSLHPYVKAVLLVAATTALGKTILSHVAPTNQVMLYLLAVVISGLRWERSATVLVSVLGVLAFDLFFVPPLYHLTVAHAEYIITFIALLIVALVIGSGTSRLREHAQALQAREAETNALYALSRRLAAAGELGEVVRAVVDHVEETFGRKASLELTASPSGESPATAGLHLPLRTPNGDLGILAIGEEQRPVDPLQRRLLEAMAAQAAVAVERAQLAEAARKATILEEAERVHDALINSVSHSLRTPLAAIIGSLSTVLDPAQTGMDRDTQRDLVETAREEADRLNRLVGHLLDMTRLESGHLKLLIDWYDLADVIGAALGQVEQALQGRPVKADLTADLPLVPLDQVLIVQVLENLLHNAVNYSPSGSPIELRASVCEGSVQVSVSDRGSGIPEGDRERVFQRFYRGSQHGNSSGTGLGLAICKGVVEAHRGRIWAEAREGGGTTIAFTLPLQKTRDADD